MKKILSACEMRISHSMANQIVILNDTYITQLTSVYLTQICTALILILRRLDDQYRPIFYTWPNSKLLTFHCFL
jgi:hypothetical protein